MTSPLTTRNEDNDATMRSSMIRNRMRALFSRPLSPSSFHRAGDGVAVRRKLAHGPRDDQRPLRRDQHRRRHQRRHISATSGKFVAHPIALNGIIYGSGEAALTAERVKRKSPVSEPHSRGLNWKRHGDAQRLRMVETMGSDTNTSCPSRLDCIVSLQSGADYSAASAWRFAALAEGRRFSTCLR
jgi:hypothetical protein